MRADPRLRPGVLRLDVLRQLLGCDYSAADAGDAWQEIADMPCEDFVDGEAEAAVFGIWGDCF